MQRATIQEGTFNSRLDQDAQRLGSLLCVGLDPHPELFEGDVADFCRRVIDQTIDAALAFKPNIAFFEASGPLGLDALRTVIEHVAGERIVILDAKRGDIGSTAQAYAKAVFHVLGADAVTVNPYLGGDAVAPFLQSEGRGAFVLCHTTNAGASDFQALDVGGGPLYLEVARKAEGWNRGDNVGLVVGATYPEEMARVRAEAPSLPFLVPGIGAQGGDLDAAVAAGLDANGRGMVVSSSRGIIFAADPGEEARRTSDAINEARVRAGGVV
jgi:orotidine 5'-phosphate decarboxylase subfamily 2